MFASILRRFSAFRVLETENSALSTELKQQGFRLADAFASQKHVEHELAEWKQRAATLEAEVARLNAEMLKRTEQAADVMAVHAIGKRLFSKASTEAPPQVAEQTKQARGRIFPHELRQQAAEQQRQWFMKTWNAQPGPGDAKIIEELSHPVNGTA